MDDRLTNIEGAFSGAVMVHCEETFFVEGAQYLARFMIMIGPDYRYYLVQMNESLGLSEFACRVQGADSLADLDAKVPRDHIRSGPIIDKVFALARVADMVTDQPGDKWDGKQVTET